MEIAAFFLFDMFKIQRQILQGRLFHIGTVLPLAKTVRLVADGASVVAIHPHGSVAMVSMEGTTRTVHGNLLQVDGGFQT